MAKLILKWADLDKTLRDFGFQEGDEIEVKDDFLPSEETDDNANTETHEGGESGDDEGDGEGGGNGSNNPGKKPPFTP